jgi:hypothetical protein
MTNGTAAVATTTVYSEAEVTQELEPQQEPQSEQEQAEEELEPEPVAPFLDDDDLPLFVNAPFLGPVVVDRDDDIPPAAGHWSLPLEPEEDELIPAEWLAPPAPEPQVEPVSAAGPNRYEI